ncbi:hypothetical protein QOZ80_2BG0195280 [Eleusine coracana subsp. coracana]|nr:hypothetical protein QOZ80_2BG0195280 [Eleusine coracana subsp. coracana]
MILWITSIKSQGECGSCWAFAAVGAVESRYAIQGARDNRGLLDLSEQELVDCDNNGHGCKGGNRNYAFDYIAKKGISSEADRLPLHRHQRHDEFELLTAVGYGPVAVGISVGKNNNDFKYYEEGDGIYDGPCYRDSRHAILLIGYTYGSYILKNSWGQDPGLYVSQA